LAAAKNAEAKGDLTEAIILLKDAVQHDPDNGLLRLDLGRLYNRSFNPVQAEKELQRAVRLGTTERGSVAVELARALRAQGKFKELLELVADDQSFEPEKRASLLALRGRAQHVLDRVAEAQDSFEQASAIASANADVNLLKAQLQSGQQKFDDAAKTLEGILAGNPDFIDAWSYKAEIMGALGKKDEALRAYGQVLRLNPKSLPALVRHSNLLIGKGDLDTAENDVKVLRRFYSNNPLALVQDGVLRLAQGDPRKALDSAQAALAKNPRFAAANLLAGLAHHALGAYSQAQTYLSKALAGDPNDPLALRALAESLIRNGDAERAVQLIEPVLLNGGADSKTMAVAATAYLTLGNNSKALEWFDKAAASNPGDAEVNVQRAIARMEGGSIKSGLDELEQAVATISEASKADEMLVLSLLANKQVDRAWRAVQDLEKRTKESAISNNLKGLVLIAQGDRQKATTAFEAALAQKPSFLPAAKNVAQIYVGAGTPELARKAYDAVIAADPENVEAILSLAELERGLGEREKMIALLERAVQVAPTQLRAVEILIGEYISLGEAKKADDLASKALELSPNEPRLVKLAAAAMSANDSANRANETIARLLQLNPGSATTVVEVARFQASAGMPEQAQSTLEKAISAQPHSAELQVALISLLVTQTKFDEAIALAKKNQDRQPDAPLGYLLEGEVREAMGEFDKAVVSYRSALSKQPSGQIATKIYLARARAGEADGALAELKAWVGENGNDIVGLAQLGDALVGRKEFRSAAEYYERIVATKEVPLDVLNNLAWSYYKLGDARALDIAEAGYQVAPRSAMIVDTLGWILLERGESKRALELLRQAAVLAPEELDIRYHLAVALDKNGQREEAKKELNKTLKAGRDFASEQEAKALFESLN